eukprot:XP_001707592.1 Hypothetical protein GL50803_37679 [Giardia lamblia ATCC 50803]
MLQLYGYLSVLIFAVLEVFHGFSIPSNIEMMDFCLLEQAYDANAHTSKVHF